MIPCFNYQFRVILIGNSMVGKSSLMKSFVEGVFTTVCDPTIGVDFFCRTVKLDDDVLVKLQLWDTAGQEKFRYSFVTIYRCRSITASYYRNCVGILIVFDLTDRESFGHVTSWYEEARSSIRCSAPVFIIVGHKSDKRTERKVSKDEAEALAETLGVLCYMETSSVTRQNVEMVFRVLADAIYSNVAKGHYDEVSFNGTWDGVKQVQNLALTASLASKSFQLSNQDETTSSRCC